MYTICCTHRHAAEQLLTLPGPHREEVLITGVHRQQVNPLVLDREAQRRDAPAEVIAGKQVQCVESIDAPDPHGAVLRPGAGPLTGGHHVTRRVQVHTGGTGRAKVKSEYNLTMV